MQGGLGGAGLCSIHRHLPLRATGAPDSGKLAETVLKRDLVFSEGPGSHGEVFPKMMFPKMASDFNVHALERITVS